MSTITAVPHENLSWPWTWLPPQDPRVRGLPFVGNFWFVTGFVLAYVYFVKVAGPRWMANREPFKIKKIINVYNFINIFVNLFFTVQFARYSYFGGGYSWFCQKMDHSTDENSMMIVTLAYYYCLVRVADFLDTVFFVLRKKFSHVTTLHYTHHALVAWSGWFFVTLGCDGQVVLGICVNSFIHVIMYTYYFLAALGPQVRPYLWWKRYITRMQITQFVCLLSHIMIPVFYDCGYPKGLLLFAFAQGSVGLVLFINFYIQSYIKNKNAPKPAMKKALIEDQCEAERKAKSA